MKKIVALISAFVIVLSIGYFNLASATSPAVVFDKVCVPSAAWTETVEHPAVTEVTPATAGVWANWSPNDTQGPQDYTPVWPVDERGTWQVHGDVPPGHAGPDGVYQQGQGNSPWFYRQAGTPEQVKVISEAFTENIEHPAVVCDGGPDPVLEPEPKVELGPVPTVKPKKPDVVIPTVVNAGK